MRETQKAVREREKQEAIEKLRELCPPGSTIYTVLRHVSRSGMQRVISLRVIRDGEPVYLDGYVATALGDRIDERRQGIVVGGCGMDMGFHLVYNLGSVLWGAWKNGTGWQCLGSDNGHRCPSSDHVNPPHPPRDGKAVHKDGGYALRHEWI